MNIDLTDLKQLQPLYKKLSSGIHINRFQDSDLWLELDKHYDDYHGLFAALGFVLVIDERGFAYFKTEQASSNISKASRRIALFLMLLFEYQADQGQHLFQFQQWRIDNGLLQTLAQHYQAVLDAEEMADTQILKETLDRAVRLGLMQDEDGDYWLLPAIHRYLDLFEELADADRPELEPLTDEGHDNETDEDSEEVPMEETP